MIEFALEKSLPQELSLQNSNRYLLEGWIFADSRLASLTVTVGVRTFPARYTEMARPDVAKGFYETTERPWSLFSGFLVPVCLHPVDVPQTLPITVRATFRSGQTMEKELGAVRLTPWQKLPPRIELHPDADPGKLVVIAMATYNPDPVGLKRQIESIRNQDYRHWVCLVCDDASNPERLQAIKAVLGDDRRFFLLENRENVGAYRNFERCLEHVPDWAPCVAMADQDDYWHPDKLSRSVARLTGPTQLAFCDMRIVDHDGNLLSETFWRNRKNYYRKKDLDLLTLANTVSATASIFRSELLQKALPFPELGGNLHHDKWLAIVAAASGGIDYVDAPLYDYVQHEDNVIGFCDFGRRSLISELKAGPTYQAYRRVVHGTPFYRRLRPFLSMLVRLADDMSLFFFLHGKQIETFAEAAQCRGLDAESLALIGRVTSSAGLLRMAVKIRLRQETTNNLEGRLLLGRLVNSALKKLLPVVGRPLWRRFCRNQVTGEVGVHEFNLK